MLALDPELESALRSPFGLMLAAAADPDCELALIGPLLLVPAATEPATRAPRAWGLTAEPTAARGETPPASAREALVVLFSSAVAAAL